MLKNHINSTFSPEIQKSLWLYHIIKQMQKLWYEENAVFFLKKYLENYKKIWSDLFYKHRENRISF